MLPTTLRVVRVGARSVAPMSHTPRIAVHAPRVGRMYVSTGVGGDKGVIQPPPPPTQPPPPSTPPPGHAPVKTGNFFMDNPGTVLAMFLAGFGAYLYYGKVGTDNKAEVAKQSSLKDPPVSPGEMKQLCNTNRVSPAEYRTVMAHMETAFPSGSATGEAFLKELQDVMHSDLRPYGLKNMHHMERMMLAIGANETETPVKKLMMAILPMVDQCTKVKLNLAFDVLRGNESGMHREEAKDAVVIARDTFQLGTKQLTTQIAGYKDFSWPMYRLKTDDELLTEAVKVAEIHPDDDGLTPSEFAAIMMSPALCMWGDCNKKAKR